MGAFYSATDDNNDRSGIYYSAVIGKLTDTTFEYVIRFNLYEQKKKCVLGDVFDIQVLTPSVPKEWLAQVENKVTHIAKAQNDFSRRRHNLPSLWDQSSSASDLPFGFEEISPRDITKGQGGKKNQTKKADPNGNSTLDWPYVNGPLDEEEIQASMLEMDLEDSEGYAGKYGKEAAESYQLIDDFMINLEECDDCLLDIMKSAYGMLTSSGQMKIATEGIR